MAGPDDKAKGGGKLTSSLASMPPPGMKHRAAGEPAELPPIDDHAAQGPRGRGGRGWRGAFAPPQALVMTQQQSQQTTALRSTADAAFGSVAALDADAQVQLQRQARALAIVQAGLSLWFHCKDEAPFDNDREFRGWMDDAASVDLKAIAALLAAHPALASDAGASLLGQVRDGQMLAAAAERAPPSLVRDYWQRLGTTRADKRPGVFLSYAHVDVDPARQLKTALGPEVLVVLDDDYLRFGETWWEVIGDAITHCKATLVLVSPAAVASRNVQDEISTAANQRDRSQGRHVLVPVFLAAVPNLPMPLQGKHGIFIEREGGVLPAAQKLKAQLA